MNQEDAFGNTLQIGDEVAFCRRSGYTDLTKGFVAGFTPKMIRVERRWMTAARPDYPPVERVEVSLKTPNQLVRFNL